MRHTNRVLLLLALILLPASLQAQAREDRLRLQDYLELERVSGPQVSPDGRQVIYTRQHVDKVNDEWESELWIVNADGSRNRFLTKGSNARWSPDGTRIAYTTRGEPQGTQIFVRWMDAEGAVSQITRVEKTPSDLAWSPDGKSIAFRMIVPERDRAWEVRLPGKPSGAKWTQDPRVVTRLRYRVDRRGYFEDGFNHIFLVPAEGGTPRQVTSGDFEHGSPEWTPDGRTIVFSGLRVDEAELQWRESDIYAVDVGSGAVRQLTSRKGPDGNARVSPDGKWIAYTGYDFTTDTWIDSKLYVMGIDGSNPRVLTSSLDRSPQDLMWAPDGSGVYFNVQDQGSQNLYFASLGGEARQLTRGTHMLDLSDIGRGGLLVGTRSAPQQSEDIVAVSARNPSQIRQLTNVNEDILAGKKLGEVEEVWYTSADGLRIQGWVIKPPDFDATRKYPLMLSIHGGPHSMYNVGFNFGWQEHAANGYVVLYTNPRGSTGYGSSFGNAIKNAYPGKDYDDLMAGVDAVIAKGYIDTANMFVYGCSGGGVLTAWIVGHTDRFRAASSNCPVTNWLSFVGTTDGNLHWYRNFEKFPWEDPTEHLRRSPLMYVGNVKTPTMLMTGVNDLRTPIAQTEEFYHALRVRGVPTAMIRFNDEWHGTSSKPSNFMRTQLYLRKWFERWGTHDDGRAQQVTTDAG